MQVDYFLATCETLTNAKIVDNVRSILENEVTKEHTDVLKVTAKEAEKALELLTIVLESQVKIVQGCFRSLANIIKLTETKTVGSQK